SSSAQHYPSYLRLWLQFERSVVVEIDSIGLTTIAPRPWPPQQNIDYAFVVNLSESPVDCANVCILEPRFDGCVDSINLFAVLLAGRNPYLSIHLARDQDPIVASYLAIQDRIVLSRGLQFAVSRLLSLVERAVCHTINGSRQAILPQKIDTHRELSTWSALRFVVRFFWHKLFTGNVHALRNREHW